MPVGLNNVLSIGHGALIASQTAIQVTGNNISNVNTPGYSRQALVLKERVSLDYYPGQIGQGVKATEIIRYFDRFIESAYLEKNASQSFYKTEYQKLSTVETIFNESATAGVSSALNAFFRSYNDLSQEPNSLAVREALVQSANTFTSAVNNAQQSMEAMRLQMDGLISSEVDRANLLIKQIAALNREINACTIEGRNNANALMDERDLLVRDLSTILDVDVQNRGAGKYRLTTRAGYVLVQEDVPFALAFGGIQVDKNLVSTSRYEGSMGFIGSDGSEYTVEVLTGGTVDTTGSMPPPPGTATYRVSTDGGRTWIANEDGSTRIFYATDEAHSNAVKDVRLHFTETGSSLTAGDTFVISPKNDVFWIEPTSQPVNISTQVYADGTTNMKRITGGTLGGYLTFRDYDLGQYMDRMDAFSRAVIWEVNRLHSQGVGLDKLGTVLGTEYVRRSDVPLGNDASDLVWRDKITTGNVSFAIYNNATGAPVIPYPGIDMFSPENFDPSKHSLFDVVNAINSGPAGAYLTATVVDNRLQIIPNEGLSFGISSDTCGLTAALGINTFFEGSDAFTLRVRGEVLTNPDLVNAGRINGAGEGNAGDNITANEIAGLLSKKVSITTPEGHSVLQSIVDYYASIVSKVGADTPRTKHSYNTQSAMAAELNDKREEISGVNLDEEMTSLIKFQSSYKAAAKLITTADEMLQTLLAIK